MAGPRIVSLLPSSSEIVVSLGFEDSLVGRSHECDFPTHLKQLPVLTAPKFNPNGSSLEINEDVSEILRYGLSVYKLDVKLLEELEPDFVVTQSQCEVCAVNMKEVEAAVCQLISSEPTIINLEPNSLQDVFDDIARVGEALDASKKATTIMYGIKDSFESIRKKTAKAPKPKLATIEWLDPIMLAGNWVPELVEIAGGESVLSIKDEHSHYFSWEQIRDEKPDVIAVMPCGFNIERTMKEMHLLTTLPGWYDMDAVKNKRVYVTDGNQYFNRPGPRLKESAEILSEILHPELFAPHHLGTGYIKFES
ncbi:MAG: cobalamin-binding protein [Bacteroidota bacterium]